MAQLQQERTRRLELEVRLRDEAELRKTLVEETVRLRERERMQVNFLLLAPNLTSNNLTTASLRLIEDSY